MKDMTLEQWDQQVGRHLTMIEAGAEICNRHATQLLAKPDFQTLALAELTRAETTLAAALFQIQRAKASYGEHATIA